MKVIKFVSFHFTAFVNKVLFLSFAFIFSLLSLLSLFFLSLSRLPNTPLEDDNSRDAWLSLLPLKRKEASLAVGYACCPHELKATGSVFMALIFKTQLHNM